MTDRENGDTKTTAGATSGTSNRAATEIIRITGVLVAAAVQARLVITSHLLPVIKTGAEMIIGGLNLRLRLLTSGTTTPPPPAHTITTLPPTIKMLAVNL